MAKNEYRAAFLGCGLASVSQAAVVNLTPVLFVPLREQYGFTYAQLGALVLVNFLTQLAADVGCSVVLDRLGFRFFMVIGHIAAALGFALFAAVSVLPITPYYGFVMATLLFSLGGGILELTTSPVVNTLPAKDKSATMSLMHGFYCWGQVSVALFTTLFLYLLGKDAWPYAYLVWMLPPLVNIVVFFRCKLGAPVPAEHRSAPFSILKSPRFIVIFLVILCAGASELTLSQWTSAFMEDVMALPKVVGDIAGMCMFAVMMGVARTLKGIKGKAGSLRLFMILGAALSFVCYIVVSVTSSPFIGLAACAFCGFGVSLLWPGALSLSVEAFPMAGSWMMAILAAGGDSGASLGPWLAGLIADHTGLRISMLSASVFPLAVVVLLIVMGRLGKQKQLQRHP